MHPDAAVAGPPSTASLATPGGAGLIPAPLQALPASAVTSGDLVDRAIADEVLLDGLDLPTWSRLRRRAGSSKPVNVLA
jgi:hypothetical protein